MIICSPTRSARLIRPFCNLFSSSQEYRGTKVAIKKAVQFSKGGSKRSTAGASQGAVSTYSNDGVASIDGFNTPSDDDSGQNQKDIEAAGGRSKMGSILGNASRFSDHFTIGFMTEDFGGKQSKWAKVFPWLQKNRKSRVQEAILGHSSVSSTGAYMGEALCPWFSQRARRKEEFHREMRVLARLRHPCITTVMGAVVTRRHGKCSLLLCFEI